MIEPISGGFDAASAFRSQAQSVTEAVTGAISEDDNTDQAVKMIKYQKQVEQQAQSITTAEDLLTEILSS